MNFNAIIFESHIICLELLSILLVSLTVLMFNYYLMNDNKFKILFILHILLLRNWTMLTSGSFREMMGREWIWKKVEPGRLFTQESDPPNLDTIQARSVMRGLFNCRTLHHIFKTFKTISRLCVCVFVCLCERKREIKSESLIFWLFRKSGNILSCIFFRRNQLMQISSFQRRNLVWEQQQETDEALEIRFKAYAAIRLKCQASD